MPRPSVPSSAPRPRILGWIAPILAGGVVGGLVVLMAWLSPSAPGTPADPLAIADKTPPEIVWLPAGTFVMGSDDGPDDERPAHDVTLPAFGIGKTEVTNGQFAQFVKETGYKTIAERVPDAKKYPTADPVNLVAGSAVFEPVKASTDPRTWDAPFPPWWKYVPGADWRHPTGPTDGIADKANHPAMHIAWDDAVAYCQWSKTRLPTEAEWEYAARGGLPRKEFCWGSANQGDGGKWYANTFQGSFPDTNTAADGFAGVAPVARFPANGYGLFDMSGNVWEWCSDNYDPGYYAKSPGKSPPGPAVGADEDGQPLKVRRGGSYLCADGYCRRYLPNARDKNPADSGASHTGFRVVTEKK
ncbi:MAG: formylglycine-generating enzyme family protein [Fimbriiglobus sp.]